MPQLSWHPDDFPSGRPLCESHLGEPNALKGRLNTLVKKKRKEKKRACHNPETSSCAHTPGAALLYGVWQMPPLSQLCR